VGIGLLARQIATAALVCLVLLLLPAVLLASDEDEEPAYLIYIDPETGKYTKQRPEGPEMAYTRDSAGGMGDAPQPEAPELAGAGDGAGALRWTAAGVLVAGLSLYLLRRKIKGG
jgi:hypothetical protein